VSLAYDATAHTLTETLTDTHAHTYSHVYTGINLGTILSNNPAYIGFTGATGGETAIQQISNFAFSNTGGHFANAVALTGNSTATIEVAATNTVPVVTLGDFTAQYGGSASVLNVAPASTVPANQAYGLTLGTVSLSSDVEFHVANNGTGQGTLTLGSVGDDFLGRSVIKSGPGTLALAAASSDTYNGPVFVNAGTLLVTNATGSATGSGAVTVAAAATLAGTGTINSVVDLSGHLAPGNNSVGTLTLTNGITLQAGAALDYDLAGVAASDKTSSPAGVVTLGTTNTLNLNEQAGFGVGTYTLMSAAGFSGTPNFTVVPSGPSNAVYWTYNVAVDPSGMNLTLQVDIRSLVWKGITNNTWSYATNSNWSSNPYGDLYKAVFDDTGLNTTNVAITAAAVAPLKTVFNNNVKDYALSGVLAGTGTVELNGTKSVTLTGANTYSGGTALNSGKLNVNASSALGTGLLTINGGSLDNTSGALVTLSTANAQQWNNDFTFVGTNSLNLGSGAVTIGAPRTVTVTAGTLTVGPIGDGGAAASLTKSGAGTLASTGNSSYTGNTYVSSGTLQLNHLASTATTQVSFGATLIAAQLTQAQLTNDGTASVTNSGTIGNVVGSGSLTVGDGATLVTNRVIQTGATGAALTVHGTSSATTAKLSLNVSGTSAAGDESTGTSHVRTLTISNSAQALPAAPYTGAVRTYYGTVDLANNDLVIDSATLADVNDMIRAGQGSTASLTWTGKGLTSSSAATGALFGATGLGAIRNDLTPSTALAASDYAASFSGQSGLVGNEILVKYTYYGDANLDGQVTALDFALLDAGYANTKEYSLNQPGWYYGDYNLDGRVNSLDYALMQAGYVAYSGSVGPLTLPEPSTLLLGSLGVAGWLLALRRRRK